MAKKNSSNQSLVLGSSVMLGHEGEYSVIKHDLIRVVVLNVIYLAAILAVYFTNAKSHYLEAWAAKLFHF